MNIELRHLRYFVAVAEELHFGRAAQRLNISQPPLSQQIIQLETETGARLFNRTNRSVQLTAAGQQLLSDARAILLQVEQAADRAARLHRGEEGSCGLALPPRPRLPPWSLTRYSGFVSAGRRYIFRCRRLIPASSWHRFMMDGSILA